MRTRKTVIPQKTRERGTSLFLVGAAMFLLIGLLGLSIDLVALYLGKSEAQRAADAAALAGAQEFVISGFTTGLITQATVQTLATNQAVTVGRKNLVGGSAPSIPSGNVTFNFTHAGDPLITVLVNATMPTFFMRIFGVTSANVTASATAEAYNPAGSAVGGPTLCASCLRPFLVPNCDPVHASPANPSCPGQGYYLNPATNYSVANPGSYSSGGIDGEPWQLHSSSGVGSQWFAIAFLGAQSKAAWQANIQSCNTDAVVCGTILQTLNGKAVGPADKGIANLIHATAGGPGNGQDTIDASGGTLPFPMYAGSNNPLVVAGIIPAGTQVTQSDSLVTVPVFDGVDTNGNNPLTPGGSQVKVTGYLQMFIKDVVHTGSDDMIDAIIIQAMSCGANKGGTCATGGNAGAGGGGSGTSGTVTAGGAGFIPVRLVQGP